MYLNFVELLDDDDDDNDDDDDSKLYFKSNELCHAVSAVNSDLNEICRWCCHNSLLMNPDNTKVLVIGLPQLL